MTTELSLETRPIADVIRERIRASFVGMIPDEAWTQLVQAEIDRFTVAQPAADYHRRQQGHTDPSALSQMVRSELETMAKAELAKVLAEPEFSSNRWENGAAVATDLIREICRQNAVEMFASIMASTVQMQVAQLRSMLR